MISRKDSVCTFHVLMNRLSDRIKKNGSHICNVEENWWIGEGETKSFVDCVTSVKIGVKERTDIEIDNDMFFMMGLVSCYHETEHVIQISQYQHETGDLAQILTVNNIACGMNPVFYIENFSQNPKELDAQLYGVYAAYLYCCHCFGKAEAERLMCHYANTCVNMGMSLMFPSLKGKYTSAQEVFEVLNEKLQESITAHRKFCFKKMLASSDANYAVSFLKNGQVMWWYPYVGQIRNTKDGFEQEKMIAAVSLKHPSLFPQKQQWLDLESLKGLDLEPSSLFDSGRFFVPCHRKNAPMHIVHINRLAEFEKMLSKI